MIPPGEHRYLQHLRTLSSALLHVEEEVAKVRFQRDRREVHHSEELASQPRVRSLSDWILFTVCINACELVVRYCVSNVQFSCQSAHIDAQGEKFYPRE